MKKNFIHLSKLSIDADTPYSADKCGEDMKEGTMTSASYPMGKGVTMMLVAEGWNADELIDEALDYIKNSAKEGA